MENIIEDIVLKLKKTYLAITRNTEKKVHLYNEYFYKEKNITLLVLWLIKKKWSIVRKIIRFILITIGLRLGLALFILDIQNDFMQKILGLFYIDYKPIFAVLTSYESWALTDYLQTGIGLVQILSILFMVYTIEIIFLYTFYRRTGHIIFVQPVLVAHGLVFLDSMWFDSGILNKDLHPWLSMVRWTLENNLYIDEIVLWLSSIFFFIINYMKDSYILILMWGWLMSNI